MTATAQAQANITNLKDRLKDFDEKIGRTKTDVEAKRKAAGKAILEGRDSSAIEEDISKIENRLNSLLAAKTEGERQLSEATSGLEAGKKTDALERIRAIRQEVDQTAIDIENNLLRAKESAEVFIHLISEARGIQQTMKIGLSKLGSWVNISNPYEPAVDVMVNSILERIKQHKPKE